MKKITLKAKTLYAFVFFFLPTMAFAKISDISKGGSEEVGSIFTEWLFWVKIAGCLTFIAAVFSWLKEKKQKREVTWEYYGMIAGFVLTVPLFFISHGTSSVTGVDTTYQAEKSASDF